MDSELNAQFTLRMKGQELDQLRREAEAAGVFVGAYLRDILNTRSQQTFSVTYTGFRRFVWEAPDGQ